MNPRRMEPDLELRLIEPRDAAEVFAVIDRNRSHLRPWLPWVDAMHRVEDEEAFIARDLDRRKASGAFACVILERSAIVGGVGLASLDLPNRKAEFGYWLDATRQGNGIVTRCCQALVSYLFHEMNLHRVGLYCGTENRRSRGVAERLGFRQEGIHRSAEWVNDRFLDLVCYAMLAPDWQA